MDTKGEKNHSNQKIELTKSPTILSDMEVIINQLENEIKQQYENVKSAIKSKQHAYLKRTIKGKQQIIEQLDEASRLLSKQADELSTKSQKSQDTILKQKQRGLLAEREKQWVAREDNLNEEFKEKRRQELIEIENQWTEKWKSEMEEKWSTIESFFKEDQPEIQLDTRKKQFVDNFMGELKLKLEGMKILWETRSNIEWTAHRLISKFQWDNESDQLWAVEKLNYIKDHNDEVTSKTDTGLNRDSKQVNVIFGIFKTQIENIFKTSKSITKNTENILHTTEKHTSKVVKECQTLHNMMTIFSTTMQRQEEDLKTLKSENEDLKKSFTRALEEMENIKITMSEEHKTNTEELRKTLAKTEHARELQSVELEWKHDQESWESQRQQLIDQQNDMNRVVEMKLKYESDSKEWQDRCEALISSECQLNRLNEKLNKDSDENIEIVAREVWCRGSTQGAKQDSTTKITGRDGRNKQPIENYQKNAANTWKCENCTLDNPHNKYICDVCGKSNEKQRGKIILEAVEVKYQRRGKLPEELLNKFTTTTKNGRSESNDTDSDLYSEGEDPFEVLDNPGRKSDGDAGLTGGQFRGEFQNKQSHDRLGKTSYGVDSDKRSNKIKHNKTADHWTCKHCTLDNSLDQYICASCGKTNDHQRTTMGNKTGAVQKQKRRNFESNEDVVQYEDENIDRKLKNVNQNATAIGWSCEHCTMENPLDQYICNGCSKTNDQLRPNND